MTEQQTKEINARNERYNKYVESVTPKTGTFVSLLKAFVIGGITCVIAELIGDGLSTLLPSLSDELVSSYTSMIIVSVAIFFTGFGFYDVIARHGGAGSFLPITGFANAMSSAALEYKSEGLILGTSVKMFTVVGPVVVNGIVWSTFAGIVRYLVMLIFGV
ncbi:MAG: SpoVA/SpoVAEb family sporulation membrane protein [Clostridia bacterium]|nr:SpoVA/SpoVAEb family sporulation membrane protein [Clostridia bacterium]